MIHLPIVLLIHGMPFLLLYYIIYRERERILPVLKVWEHKGYLTIVYDDTTAFVLNVEKLPSKERLIEESRNVNSVLPQ